MSVTNLGPVADVVLETRSSAPTSVGIVREPLTYDAVVERGQRGGIRVREPGEEPRSYFLDIYRASRGDSDAQQRLERHGQEMDREYRDLGIPPPPEVEVETAPEARTTTSSYAAPPLWLIRHFAEAPRPARVLADLAPGFTLPKGAFSINLPRATQGASEDEQQLAAPVEDVDVTDAAVTSPVTTLAGEWDVPIQFLDQSPQGAHFDWVAFRQLTFDYDFKLEYQMINGSGAGNAITGILNNSSIPTANVLNYTGAVTATTMFTTLGQALAQVGNQRLLPPEAWLMRTNRFAWLGSSEDQQNRPLMITDKDGTGEFDLLGTSVQQDNAIPNTFGNAANQDAIICCRPSDWLLLESPHHLDTLPEVLSGSMEVRFQLRGYVAALLRHPSSVSYLTGSGMSRPTGF